MGPAGLVVGLCGGLVAAGVWVGLVGLVGLVVSSVSRDGVVPPKPSAGSGVVLLGRDHSGWKAKERKSQTREVIDRRIAGS